MIQDGGWKEQLEEPFVLCHAGWEEEICSSEMAGLLRYVQFA